MSKNLDYDLVCDAVSKLNKSEIFEPTALSSLLKKIFRCGTKVNVQNRSEPSSGILHCYHLTRGSMLTSQDYSPSSVVYVPELIRAI